MRIIGGELRGKQIFPPKGYMARPTTDFAKEGLFNILTNLYDLKSVSVLDLFSGTGSIGYEFASRGTQSITSVEMNPANYRFIRNTIAELGLKEKMHVVHHNVFDFLPICKLRYDIIFIDPPYDIDKLASIPDRVLSYSILKENGTLILEHPAAFNFSNHPCFTKVKNYGNVHFSFFRTK